MSTTENSDWKVSSLRVTFFLKAGEVLPNQNNWWETATDTDPDTVTEKPKEGFTQASGIIKEGVKLQLLVNPDRVDWVVASEIESSEDSPFQLIGDFDSALELVMEPVSKWFSAYSPDVARIAFGAIMNDIVESRIEGYQKLNNFLNYVELDSEGSSDFSYTINRPRVLGNGLQVNRLSKWNVRAFVRLRLPQQDIREGATIVSKTSNTLSYSCHLELDINTAPIYEIIDHPMEALGQLIEEGKEILVKGDVK